MLSWVYNKEWAFSLGVPGDTLLLIDERSSGDIFVLGYILP